MYKEKTLLKSLSPKTVSKHSQYRSSQCAKFAVTCFSNTFLTLLERSTTPSITCFPKVTDKIEKKVNIFSLYIWYTWQLKVLDIYLLTNRTNCGKTNCDLSIHHVWKEIAVLGSIQDVCVHVDMQLYLLVDTFHITIR